MRAKSTAGTTIHARMPLSSFFSREGDGARSLPWRYFSRASLALSTASRRPNVSRSARFSVSARDTMCGSTPGCWTAAPPHRIAEAAGSTTSVTIHRPGAAMIASRKSSVAGRPQAAVSARFLPLPILLTQICAQPNTNTITPPCSRQKGDFARTCKTSRAPTSGSRSSPPKM